MNEAQAVQPPINSVELAGSPNTYGTLRRNTNFSLAHQQRNLQQSSSNNFQGQFSEPKGFQRHEKYILPQQPADSSFAPVKDAALAARIEAGTNVGYVGTSGTNFVLNGKIRHFSGSNSFFLVMRCCPTHILGFMRMSTNIALYCVAEQPLLYRRNDDTFVQVNFAVHCRNYLTDAQVKLFFKVCRRS